MRGSKTQRRVASPARRQTANRRRPDWFDRLPEARANLTQGRLILVWAILVAGCTLLGANLLRLQVFETGFLVRRAKQQQTKYLRPFVPRRPIIDRNGNVMAIDRPSYEFYAHPRYFKRPNAEVAAKLAPIIGQPESDLLRKFNADKSGIRLSTEINEDVAKRIRGLFIDGLELNEWQQRLYPQQSLLSNIIGYVDHNQKPQAGLEYSFRHILEQSPKSVRLNRTGEGVILPDGVPNGFINQDDLRLQLTIDSRLQRAITPIVNEQVKAHGAKRGLVMVLDASDGAILSMVSSPSFDPNKYYEVNNLSLFKNWALTDLYEPGSTFKPIVVAMALESGSAQMNDYFYDSGYLEFDGWPIYNSDKGARGSISLTQIIKYSSNIGMVRVGQAMKPDTYYSWLERIGLGQKTGIDLPFEAIGQMHSRKTFVTSPIDRATTSFGQGFSLTPLQLLKMHGMLASGGKMVTPHIVKGLYDSDGKAYWEPQRAMPKQIFTPKNTRAVLRMMEQVVATGTGRRASVSGYRVAGKTGTAQKAGSGGYIEGAYITSFVGIFPVDNPRYVVLSVLDEPQGQAYGGTTAAPVVKKVIEIVAGVEKVPPSKSDAPKPSQ
ncbi:penicillin-binding protein 2 [filamentous cyanobacterium LEGE 11480]|uniref:Penicillin-binding protein 2 n=1 Tax=Romeriopsis navalis LEGE 11480 TaxID=2777977 RepID=A0A928Z4T7_9CYAN|nr:penicillin-binding protein 2 [Romeriopsis navalis LEGE 11480]